MLKGLRGVVARSLMKKSLFVARKLPPWHEFMSLIWSKTHDVSGLLLKSHSLEEFEKLFRPTLLPKESLADIRQQGWDSVNNMFQSWLRNQFLEKKYGNTDRYYNAEKELEDQSSLPSVAKLQRIFDLADWAYKTPQNKQTEEKIIHEQILSKVKNQSTKNLSFEEVLEMAGCAVVGRNEFNWFCEANKIYEFFTSDYVEQLGLYLRKRALEIAGEKNIEHIKILEVGAGSGVLSHFLANQSALAFHKEDTKSKVSISLVATDSGASDLHINPEFKVSKAKYISAIQTIVPDIVVCSWMPMDDDWTVFFRQFSSVSEYVLIGEFDNGCCGHNWFTWGNVFFRPKKGESDTPPHFERLITEEPPYEKDYFTRTFMDRMSSIQYSRYDSKYSRGNSGTFVFRKSANLKLRSLKQTNKTS